MFLYLTLGTTDLARAVPFYDAVLGALGHARLPGWADGWASWGRPYGEGASLWLCPPFDGAPANPGNGTMAALDAPDAATVRRAHAAGLAHGGIDDGPPGLRDAYGPDFYVAYLRDPDGHKIAIVHHRYDPSEETG